MPAQPDLHEARPGPVRPRRNTVLATLGAAGLVSMAALAAAAPAEAHTADRASPAVAVHSFRGALTDLQPAASGPFDAARGGLVLVQHGGSSTFVLTLSGVGREAAGQTFGAHLHTGPCVAGNGAAAGPHYNQSTVEGVVPPIVNDETEVWLDVTITPGGSAVAVARVPFVPSPGDRAIVVHEKATDDHGTAGSRLACLPVSWS